MDIFPDSTHVEWLGLGSANDDLVWQAARDGGFAIVTKDVDYQDLAILRGTPPKVIWIRRGNCSTASVEDILRQHTPEIRGCMSDPECRGLMLY